jgi:hypothetical protein
MGTVSFWKHEHSKEGVINTSSVTPQNLADAQWQQRRAGPNYQDMKIRRIDHQEQRGSLRSETLDFAMSSSTITVLKTLAKHIAAHLEERAFCVVFEDDLDRCWPSRGLKRAEREKEIQSFARSQGWAVVTLTVDSGIRAIFRKPEPSSANYERSSVPAFESNLETAAGQTVRPLESIA